MKPSTGVIRWLKRKVEERIAVGVQCALPDVGLTPEEREKLKKGLREMLKIFPADR